MNSNIGGYMGCDKTYEASEIVLFGAPYDCTSSYRPGSRFAGSAIRAQSYGIEMYSPYQDSDLADTMIFDAGDLDLPFGAPEPVLDIIENFALKLFKDQKKLVMLGGEHLVTLGTICAAACQFKNLAVIHFDAHADLRDDYLGQKLSHATVMRRVWEIVGDGSIYQMGIRSGERAEFEFAREHVFTCRFDCSSVKFIKEQIKDRPVYLTLDMDILDPSIFPGTGTPEPGGIGYMALLDAILQLKGLNIIGADLNELSPDYDLSGCSTIVACKTLRELFLMLTAI